LVGVVTWDIAAPENDIHNTSIHFSWRDSVTFSDGTVVGNTGRFVTDRPPGLVVAGKLKCTTITILGIPFTICTIVYETVSQR
jgi:hypothetical protein